MQLSTSGEPGSVTTPEIHKAAQQPDEVAPADVERWMIAAREQYAASTINSWRRVLRTVYNAARAELGLRYNPVDDTRPLRELKNLEEPNAVTSAELRQILTAMRSMDRVLYAAALTQALTGLRWQEVSALYRVDLDREERIPRIRRKTVRGRLEPTTTTGRARRVGVRRC